MQFLKFSLLAPVTTIVGVLSAVSVNAITVDFESGFEDLDLVNTVSTNDGNRLIFTTGSGISDRTSFPFIAEVGAPPTAFLPNDGEGTSFENQIGNYILTDFNGSGENPSFGYFIEFEKSISNFSVDLLDYVETLSGGNSSSVTVTAYSDIFNTNIGSVTATNQAGLPDSVSLDTVSLEALGDIRSISIIGDVVDTGTAIDNITFTTATTKTTPEPNTVLGILVVIMFYWLSKYV